MSTQKKNTSTKKDEIVTGSNFVFGKENYVMMGIGLAVIFVGFVLMSGGKSEDPNVFNPEIFNTQRIIIAPMVVIAGFVIEAIAIFRKTKD